MKKVLLSLSLVVSLFASDKVLTPKEATSILSKTPFYAKLKNRLNKNLKIKGMIKDSFYIITVYDKKSEGNILVTKDLKYTILGNVINNKTKQPLRAEYPAKKFQGSKQIVNNGVLFSFGNGKEDLYIVTDPQCPYCQKFEKLAKKTKLSEKYKIHIIFLPLPFHKNAPAMIEYILSGKDDKEKSQRFHKTLTGDNSWQTFKATPKQKERIANELKKSKKAVEELGARGTPYFYDKNLKEIKNRGQLFK